MSCNRLRPAGSSAIEQFAALMEQVAAVAGELDPEGAIAASGELERVRMRLWRRALATPAAPEPGDRLLSAKEAAKLLDVPERALYRESWSRAFTVRLTEGRVRFSEKGIQRFIRSQAGGDRHSCYGSHTHRSRGREHER